MSFIANLMTMLDSIESDALLVHQERCVSVRNRNVHCLHCAEACASKAIAYHENEFRLDSSRCIGCGTCVTACPTGAIEMKNPSDDELIHRVRAVAIKTDGHPVIACESAVRAAVAEASGRRTGILSGRQKKTAPVCDRDRVCELPCLGRLDESLLIDLAVHEIDTVTLVCSSCDTCQHATGGALMREVVQSTHTLIEAFGSTMTIDIEQKEVTRVPLTSVDVIQENGLSRRDFFRSLKEGSLQAVSAVGQKALVDPNVSASQKPNTPDEKPDVFARLRVNAEGLPPQTVPSRRRRISHCLEYLGEPVVERIETRTSGSVLIDTQRCNSCRMCAVFCPTGALSKNDEADRYGIMHRATACVRCRLCEQMCPRDAITLDPCVPIDQFLGKKAVCYRMEKAQWTPNRPDSMFEKMHTVLGADREMCML
jgi:Fe-S-cluster-containing hydrogenase component 2/coenzyme F420-reducing hydrogenase delta subunit